MRLGLLVGANGYDQLGSLRFCVQDALALKEILLDKSRGGFEPDYVKLLVDGDKVPIKANIIDQLEILASKATGEDEILFYFSGHGYETSGKSYLAPLDARTSRPDETSVPIDRLGDMLRGSKARTKVIILDACYSGLEPGKASSGGMSTAFEEMLREMASKGSGTIILTSCSKGESSYEDADFKHGVFTHFLVEGLRGNADSDHDYDITVTEVYQYVRQKVDEHSLKSGNKQTPNFIGSMSGDVMLVRVPRPASPSTTTGPISITKIILSKYGKDYSVDDYGYDESQEYASSDALNLSGELGAIVGKIYGPARIKKLESEYRFPRGSYYANSSPDNEGSTFSSWAIVKVDPAIPDGEISMIIEKWNPTRIEITLNHPLNLAGAYDSLEKNEYKIISFVPDRSVQGSGGLANLSVMNHEVEAVVEAFLKAGSWSGTGIKELTPSSLLSLVT